MKKILLSAILLLVLLTAKSQSTLQFNFCFNSIQPTYMDSVLLTATLNASTGYSGIKFSQVSGPNTSTFENPVNNYQNTMVEQSTQWVKGLIPGTYVFQATGTSLTGQASTFTDSVTILALPSAATITGLTVTLFGIVITVPAGQGTKITLSNGTVQTF